MFIGLPVSQAGIGAVSGIFISKPAVIQQKEVYAQSFGAVKQGDELTLIIVKISGFPVIQQGQPLLVPIINAVVNSPFMKVPADLAESFFRIRKNKFWCVERFAG